MKISIVMCFKNEAKHLDDTIQSILSQSEPDFELIAVDDHSEDESVQLLKKYAQRDSRVSLLANQGHGIIDALKTAYSAVSGDLVTRHDADDLMPDHKLATLKELLLTHGPGHVATGLVSYFSEGNLAEGFIKYADWLNELCRTNSHAKHVFKECVIASPNWMAYKTDLESINAFQDEDYPEDYHLVFKMIEKKLKVVSSDRITHLWRDHPARVSRTMAHCKDQKFYVLKVAYFLKFYGKEDIVLWGTGPSGKSLAKELVAQGVEFKWVSNNTKKIGKSIYGISVEHHDSLNARKDEKVVIAVTQRGSAEEITGFLDDVPGCQYFNF
ncbi:glycosyltransferase [bacterium]|jgi:glycosyltransferase involved in cell wall biosynthesis|nr:glycosyltransferase [bacterium]